MRKFIFLLPILIFSQSAFALILASSAFTPYGMIPAQYTCDGANQSPPLQWGDMPDKAQSLVLILSDPDAPSGTWDHWVVFNLPASINGLAAGVQQLPSGTVLPNSWGKTRYNGPCPPAGAAHHYIFQIYAIDESLALPNNATKEDVLNAIQDHTLASAELIGVYTRGTAVTPPTKLPK